jgi:hypothetical protein
MTLVVGCSSTPDSPTSGSIPLPAANAGPDAAALPAAAPDPGGSPQTAAATLAAHVKAGGTGAQAALRTALRRGGITVTEVDGTVVAKGADPSLGISIPIGQLMFVAGENTPDHGERIADVGSVLDAIWSDKIDSGKLATAILTDLRAQAGGTNPHDPQTLDFLSAFIVDVGQQATPPVDLSTGDASTVLSGLQTWLLWLALAGGAYTKAVVAAGPKKSADTTAQTVLVDDPPCSQFNGKVGDAAANAAGGITGGVPFSPWDGVSSFLGEGNPGKVMGLGEWLGVANAALSLVHLLVEGLSLTAKASLNPTPLVRTKGIAPAHGDQGTLKVTLQYKLPHAQYANCLRAALNASGLDFSLPNDGPVTDAETDWDLYDDPGGITNNPAQFYSLNGDNPVKTRTDSDGTTTTGLEGRPQKAPVPDGVKPFERHVTIIVGVVVKPTEILGTLNDAISAALGGVAAPAIIAVNMLERSQAFHVKFTVTIRDWPLDFKIDANVDQNTGAGNNPHLSGLKCDGVAGAWHLSVNGGGAIDFTLDANGKGTAQGDLGPVNVTLIQGDPAQLQFSIPGGYYQTVPVTPGQFCNR